MARAVLPRPTCAAIVSPPATAPDLRPAWCPDTSGWIFGLSVTPSVVVLGGGGAGKEGGVIREQRPENRHGGLERFGGALLLLLEGGGYARLLPRELRVGVAHLLRQVRDQLVEERLLLVELVPMAHGAACDPAHDVAATFPRPNDAIRDHA